MSLASLTSLGTAAPVFAGVPAPVAVLFWLWFLVSMVVLGVRLARRSANRSEDAEASGGSEPIGAALVPPPSAASPSAGLGPGDADLVDRTGPPPVAPPAAAPAPRPADAPPAAPASGGDDARSGFFARRDAATAGTGADEGGAVGRRPTVAEALQGIAMPCGLTPVTDGSSSIPNPFRVAFLTTEADAASVGAGVGDELERLGYSLATAAPTELVARRDDAEVRVVLYPSPATARRGPDPVFPAAPAQAVGVEFTT